MNKSIACRTVEGTCQNNSNYHNGLYKDYRVDIRGYIGIMEKEKGNATGCCGPAAGDLRCPGVCRM